MAIRILFAAIFCFLLITDSSQAQFRSKTPDEQAAVNRDSTTQVWKAGMEVTGGPRGCRDVKGTVTVPMDWPEQRVRVLDETTSGGSRITYRTLPPGFRQMVITNPSIGPGQKFEATVLLEVDRIEQLPPEDTDQFELATGRAITQNVRRFLAPSPYIESTNSKMRSLFYEITSEHDKAWDKISAIYDWVRDEVEYKDENQTVKGALAAIRDGYGDCEDMASLFIAICRAGKIPARTVWVHGHCYPEFYVMDAEGKGHWFPCQIAGTYAFGGMPDLRIILQKGDLVRTPEQPSEAKRYASEFFRSVPKANPPADIRFIREQVSR